MTYQFFPRSQGLQKGTQLYSVVKDCFEPIKEKISSQSHNMSSNEVLSELRESLVSFGFHVEAGKKSDDKIRVPVLYGKSNRIDKEFNADAVSDDGSIVIEVEAGRAVDNNQFLKDIFQASMMVGVDYLVLAVREDYRGHDDFDKVYTFLETMYISSRIQLPLKGILLIGY